MRVSSIDPVTFAPGKIASPPLDSRDDVPRFGKLPNSRWYLRKGSAVFGETLQNSRGEWPENIPLLIGESPARARSRLDVLKDWATLAKRKITAQRHHEQ
jgi:hypothetical protein